MARIKFSGQVLPGYSMVSILQVIACLLLGQSYPTIVSAVTEIVIDDREMLQAAFPAGSDIHEQQVMLDENLRERIDRRFHFKPAIDTVTVWMASDPTDGRLLGGMIKADGLYQQQPLTVAIAMSVEQRIKRTAIVAIDPLIREAFESTIGVGYLKRYTMLSARQLSYMVNVLAKQDEPSAWAAEQIFHYGAILAAILESKREEVKQ